MVMIMGVDDAEHWCCWWWWCCLGAFLVSTCRRWSRDERCWCSSRWGGGGYYPFKKNPFAFVPSLKLLETSRSHLTPSPNLPLNPPARQGSPPPPCFRGRGQRRERAGGVEKRHLTHHSSWRLFTFVACHSLTHSLTRTHSSSQLTAGSLRLGR